MPGVRLYTQQERKIFADNAVEILELLHDEGAEDSVDAIAKTAVASAWIALAAL